MATMTKPAPTAQDFDREFRAQVAQMTAGLAPDRIHHRLGRLGDASGLVPGQATGAAARRDGARGRYLDVRASCVGRRSAGVARRRLFGRPRSTLRSRGLVAVSVQRLRACVPEQPGPDERSRARRQWRDRLSHPAAGVRSAHAARCDIAVELPGVESRAAGADPVGAGTEPGARVQARGRGHRAHAEGQRAGGRRGIRGRQERRRDSRQGRVPQRADRGDPVRAGDPDGLRRAGSDRAGLDHEVLHP